MTPANETPRYPHAEEYADIEDAWGDDPSEPFAFDALAVATEYVAAEVRAESLWLSLLGAVGVFIAAFGLCAWAAFGQTQDWNDPKNQRTEFYTVLREVARIPGCVETFPRLDVLAERLNVPKVGSGDSAAIQLKMCNGSSYDFIALVNALLDRLDEKTPR